MNVCNNKCIYGETQFWINRNIHSKAFCSISVCFFAKGFGFQQQTAKRMPAGEEQKQLVQYEFKIKRRWCVFATYITHFQTKLREYRQSSFPMRLPCTTLEEIRIIGLKSREKVITFGQFRAWFTLLSGSTMHCLSAHPCKPQLSGNRLNYQLVTLCPSVLPCCQSPWIDIP